MKILKTEFRQCPSCMEEHEVQTVEETESTGTYTYEYCTNTEELWQTEEMMRANQATYRKSQPSQDRMVQAIEVSVESFEKICCMLEDDEEKMAAKEEVRREKHKNDPPMTEKQRQKIMQHILERAKENDIELVRKERDNLRRRLFLCKRDNRTGKDKLKNDIAKAKQFHMTDSDLWDMDYALAELILPNLIRFKKINTHSHPIMHDEDLHGLEHSEAWKKALDDMIYSMQEAVNDYDHERFNNSAEIKEYGEKVQKGFELFGKYFCHLWD